jgi:hypothetical protein
VVNVSDDGDIAEIHNNRGNYSKNRKNTQTQRNLRQVLF